MEKSAVREQWCPVADTFYGAVYEVSDLGRVRRIGKPASLKPGLSRPKKGSPYTKHVVCLSRSSKTRTLAVSRLVLEAFVGPAPKGHEACHRNGDTGDNRLSNLRWGTHATNGKDMVRHGTSPRGERHGMSKLSDIDADAIRSAVGKHAEIAVQFGVSRSLVTMIRSGKRRGRSA